MGRYFGEYKDILRPFEFLYTRRQLPVSSADGCSRCSASRRVRAVLACKVKVRDGEVEGEVEFEESENEFQKD